MVLRSEELRSVYACSQFFLVQVAVCYIEISSKILGYHFWSQIFCLCGRDRIRVFSIYFVQILIMIILLFIAISSSRRHNLKQSLLVEEERNVSSKTANAKYKLNEISFPESILVRRTRRFQNKLSMITAMKIFHEKL